MIVTFKAERKFHTKLVGIFMINLHTKFHMYNYDSLFVNTVKQNSK